MYSKLRDLYQWPENLKPTWIVDLYPRHSTFDGPERYLKPYGEWFTCEEAESIQSLDIGEYKGASFRDNLNNESDARKAFAKLSDMSAFANMKALSIPEAALLCLDMDSLAPSLEYLWLCPDDSFVTEKALAKQLVFFEQCFPKLKSLRLNFPPSCYVNFNVDHFPALQWLDTSFELEKSAKSLKLFHDKPSMQGFGLNGVSKKDILDRLNRNIQAITFWDVSTRSLDLTYLQEFRGLKYLDINAAFTLDCKILAELPQLEEVVLLNAKRLDNIEALLESTSLQRLAIKWMEQGKLPEALQRSFRDKLAEFETD